MVATRHALGDRVAASDVSKNNRQYLSPEQVQATLLHMFSVAPFRDAPQLRAFLGFVVKESLEGRGNDIKGYSIATLALGRPESFDPQTDPIVRVQAGRVRQALAEFYTDHPDESVIISLEKGTYTPQFSLRTAGIEDDRNLEPESGSVEVHKNPEEIRSFSGKAAKSVFLQPIAIAMALCLVIAAIAGWWGYNRLAGQSAAAYNTFVPSLVVELDGQNGGGELASVAERTRDAISRFDDVVVVQDVSDIEKAWQGADNMRTGIKLVLKISGAAAGQDQIRIRARLVDSRQQALLWSREFDPFPTGPTGDAQRSSIVKAIAATVAQPYGVIHTHVRSLVRTAKIKDDPYGCIVASFDYWLLNDRKRHLEARTCIERRLNDFPAAAPMHAQMAYLHLEEYRQDYNQLPGNPLERALLSAQKAVQLSPTSARNHQALMATHFARKEMDIAWRAAADALRLNPYDTEILGDIGARHVQSGDYEKGLALLQQALDLNTSPPTWAIVFRAIGLYMLGRAEESGRLAATLVGSDYPPAMMIVAMGAALQRNVQSATKAMEALKAKHPAIYAEPLAYLNRLSFDDKTAKQIVYDFERVRAWLASNPR